VLASCVPFSSLGAAELITVAARAVIIIEADIRFLMTMRGATKPAL
jgi:hypothetical protein